MSGRQRILLYGYHGLRNAGAESRLAAIIHELRCRFEDARIRVATFDRHGLDYLSGVEVRYVNPALYRRSTRRLIRDSDVVVLTEGNLLSDSFTAQMVQVHAAAMEEAHEAGVPTVGLALDAGPLAPSRRPRVMRAVNRLALLTLRTAAALDDLLDRGLTLQATVTADCAVSMPLPTLAERSAVLASLGLEGATVHGLAPVDFFMYPARIAPVGRPADYVRYPFRGSWPGDGRARSAELARQWIELGRRQLRADPDAVVAVVAMDPSDERISRLVGHGIGVPERTRLVSCRGLNTFEMSAVLSGLTSMVTSRYHALVMPLAYSVPFVALGHDNRMRYITTEMGLDKYFVDRDTEDLADVLADRHLSLLSESAELRPHLASMFEEFRGRDQENYDLLATVVERAGTSASVGGET